MWDHKPNKFVAAAERARPQVAHKLTLGAKQQLHTVRSGSLGGRVETRGPVINHGNAGNQTKGPE